VRLGDEQVPLPQPRRTGGKSARSRRFRRAVAVTGPEGPTAHQPRAPRLSPQAARGAEPAELALKEAKAQRSVHVRSEHLLLGIARVRDGLAAGVLRVFGIDGKAVGRRLGRARATAPSAAVEGSTSITSWPAPASSSATAAFTTPSSASSPDSRHSSATSAWPCARSTTRSSTILPPFDHAGALRPHRSSRLGWLDLDQHRRWRTACIAPAAQPVDYRHRARAVVSAAAVGTGELDEHQKSGASPIR
jgi:Clp amino terminal domain, pathogenicity island component